MRKFFRDDTGVGAIEFALIAPLLALVLLGVISGWAYYTQNNYMRDSVEVAGQVLPSRRHKRRGCGGYRRSRVD